jgi:hypothetical protein
MKSRTLLFAALVMCIVTVASVKVYATPTTTYWTPSTMDIQPFGVLHIGVDNYFTVFRKYRNSPKMGGAGAFPTDAGLTIGVLPFEKIQMEIGVDLVEPSNYSVYFNAKIGTPEDSLFPYSPGISVGIFNAGLHRRDTPYPHKYNFELNNRNDYNIGYVTVGRSIPYLGRVHASYYYGNPHALITSAGNRANRGFMVGFDRGFWTVKDSSGEYSKFVIAADYCSGENYIGGYGGGIYYFFTKNISLLVGPVWFNDERMNGQWKITAQLDINVDLLGKSQ